MDIISQTIFLLDYLIRAFRALEASEIKELRTRRWFEWHSRHSWTESQQGRLLLRHRSAPLRVAAIERLDPPRGRS
jgi:hypothetical protein